MIYWNLNTRKYINWSCYKNIYSFNKFNFIFIWLCMYKVFLCVLLVIDSNMFLNISQDVLHVTVVCRILEVTSMVIIVVCTASVSMRCCWEFHVHHWLVWEIFRFTVVFWRPMRSVSHQIPIWKAVVVHVTVCELLLVLIHFV